MASTVAASPKPGPHTWADFIALDEDDLRELIDGDLVEVEVPTELHEHIVMTLGFFLKAWARAHARGRVLGSGYKVRITENRGVMPDLQFYRTDNPAPREPQGLVSGHPDLVVEVVSPSSRRADNGTKLVSYASIGVPEYWLVDADGQFIQRMVLRDGMYAIAEHAGGSDLFRPDTFPGLEIPLAELWELSG